jgi:hypothetical protein
MAAIEKTGLTVVDQIHSSGHSPSVDCWPHAASASRAPCIQPERSTAYDVGAVANAEQEVLVSVFQHGGGLPPVEAWACVARGEALLVDVRSAEELKFVGQVPGSVHVAWATGTALTRNPHSGLYMRIRHSSGVETFYGHLSRTMPGLKAGGVLRAATCSASSANPALRPGRTCTTRSSSTDRPSIQSPPDMSREWSA